ncbi:MAG: nitrate reductase cytochrome c-type subunit [Sneathiella sp.]
MNKLVKFVVIAMASFVGVSGLVYAESVVTLRDGAKLDIEVSAPVMSKVENKDMKRGRNYPEQPPTIPHHIRDYEISLNANKCLSCHARTRTEESQAPMISVTHFMDRDFQVLATVSPRRYNCTQCHVTQKDVKPLVGNSFVDVENVIEKGKAAQ